jgi:hypothetical protein
VSRPLKALLPDYRELEDRMQRAINRWFGLPEEIPGIVKEHDTALCEEEIRTVMFDKGHTMLHEEAEKLFLWRFKELTEFTSAEDTDVYPLGLEDA